MKTHGASITKNLDKGISLGKTTEEIKSTALNLLSTTFNLEDLKVDLVIEAIVERLDVKVKLFKELAEINGEKTILRDQYIVNTHNPNIGCHPSP